MIDIDQSTKYPNKNKKKEEEVHNYPDFDTHFSIFLGKDAKFVHIYLSKLRKSFKCRMKMRVSVHALRT